MFSPFIAALNEGRGYRCAYLGNMYGVLKLCSCSLGFDEWHLLCLFLS